MARHLRHVTSAAVCLVWLVCPATRASADPPPTAPPVPGDIATPQAKAAAQKHFLTAQELYQEGSYREAIAELEAAAALDPKAKDLYFNIGVVDEKLGRIDEALEQFKRYATFDLEAQERARVEKYIRRLEGAKLQLASQPAPTFMPPPGYVQIVREPEHVPNGRIDAATIATASASALGLVVGTIFAVQANATKPDPGFVTGRDGTYAELEDKATSAHRLAMIADVGFAIGIVAGAASAYLYFSRPRVTEPPPAASAQLAGALVPGGAALLVRGLF